MFFSIPNLLTFGRLLLIPFIVACFYYDFPHHHGVTASLFLVGAATDWLDGYLARKWEQTSKLGAFLDPVADKLIVATALCLFIEHISQSDDLACKKFKGFLMQGISWR